MFQPPFMRPNMPQSWFGGRAKAPVGSTLPPTFIGNRQPGLPGGPMSPNAFLPVAQRPDNMAAQQQWAANRPPAPAGGQMPAGLGSGGSYAGASGGASLGLPGGMPDMAAGGGMAGAASPAGPAAGGTYQSPFSKG